MTDQVNFPNLPPLPPGFNYDPTTWSNWPPRDKDGNYAAYTTDGMGYMQVLMNTLTLIDAHPGTTQAFMSLAKTIFLLSQLKQPDGSSLLGQADIDFFQTAQSGNLMKTALDQAAQFAFLYGYNGQTGGAAYTQFATDFQNILNQIPAGDQNVFTQDMLDETNTLLNSTFITDHTNSNPNAIDAFGNPVAVGDLIWTVDETYVDATGTHTRKMIYDWTKAYNADKAAKQSGQDTPDWAKNTMQYITGTIQNSNPATGGSQPNPDIDALDAVLFKMQMDIALGAFMEMFKETHDIGYAIFALFLALEGYKMNQYLSGPADVMDKEKKLSQWAKQIEDQLKQVGSAGFSGTQAMEIVGNTITLFQSIMQSGQFADGLSGAVLQAKSTFQNTMIIFPPIQPTPDPSKGETYKTRSLWDLFTATSLPTSDPNHVEPNDLAAALQKSLAPQPSGTPTGSEDSGALALQGVLGGYDGLITAVSSNSSAQVTTAQQGESLIQAIDKILTGVTDKNTGMNVAVIQKTLNLPA